MYGAGAANISKLAIECTLGFVVDAYFASANPFEIATTRQVQILHHQLPAALHLEQTVRPAADDFWQHAAGVWDAGDVQRAGDDDFFFHQAVPSDLDAATGGNMVAC